MDVANSNSQGVRCVIWFGKIIQVQQRLHHALHLPLSGAAVTAHRLLDFVGRIFVHGQVGLGQREHGDTPCLTDRDGCFNVLLKK